MQGLDAHLSQQLSNYQRELDRPVKTYQVEIRYTVYHNFTIEADNEEQAEVKAWALIEADTEAASGYGEWECLDVEEVKP